MFVFVVIVFVFVVVVVVHLVVYPSVATDDSWVLNTTARKSLTFLLRWWWWWWKKFSDSCILLVRGRCRS